MPDLSPTDAARLAKLEQERARINAEIAKLKSKRRVYRHRAAKIAEN